MGNICGREREDFDADLNKELNSIIPRGAPEQEDPANEVNFDDVMALKNKHTGGGCCGGSHAKPAEMSSTVSPEEMRKIQLVKSLFDKYCATRIKGKEEYIEVDGKQYLDPEFLCFILRSALFWKEVRMESSKTHMRNIRRMLLFGTDKPGGPDVEISDPAPEIIMKYMEICDTIFEQDDQMTDDTLNAIIQTSGIKPEQFGEGMEKYSEDPEGVKRQEKLYLESGTFQMGLDKETLEGIGRAHWKPLTDDEALNILKMKHAIQIEMAQDVADTKKQANQMPESMKQQVYDQLEMGEQLQQPMIADQIWFKTNGKYEWTERVFEIELIATKKRDEKDTEWIQAIGKFNEAIKKINQSVEEAQKTAD